MVMGDQPASPGKPSLAVRIDQEKSRPLAWKAVAQRAAMAAVAGLAIYLVFPAITEVLASWPRLSTLNPWWLFAAIAAEVAHFACTFALQRLALRTKAWFGVITSQLAGNAITLIMPGGAAVGAAVQFRMLATSGMDTSSAVGGLAAFSLLGVGGLLALPVFALPVILIGAPTNRGLENAAFLGAAGFVAFAAFGAVVLAYDAPLRWAGRAAQRVRNLILRKRPPLEGLDATLLAQRDEIRAVLGKQWWQALLLSAGRLAFDYLCLLFALRATGSYPRPSLILVAYAVAGIVGMIPATPGGLGLVEASLTGLLVLAEVDSSQAVLATLTYRIASYWVPLLAGPIAYGLFKFRYRKLPGGTAAGELAGNQLLPAADQVEKLVEDAVDGAHGHRQVPVTWHQVSAGAADVGGQPPAVRERDHPVLVALPDRHRCRLGGHRRRGLPAQGEAPVPGEREVVVPPARDAGVHRGAQGGGEVIGELPGERGLVGLEHQAAQRPGHALPGEGAHHGRLLLQEGGQRGFAAQCRAELRDVLGAHAGQPVQALRLIRRHPGDGGRRQAAPGQGRGAGQRVRPAAGPAGRDEGARAELVQDRRGVLGHVGYPPARPGRRPLVAGPGGQDDPQAAFPGRLHRRRVQDQPDRSALVQHQRQAIRLAGHEEVDDPAVGAGEAASFGLHGGPHPRLAEIRDGVTRMATRRSWAITRS